LNDKDFNKKTLAIQPPVDATEKMDKDGASTVGDTEEDITDPRMLYAKVMNLAKHDKIDY